MLVGMSLASLATVSSPYLTVYVIVFVTTTLIAIQGREGEEKEDMHGSGEDADVFERSFDNPESIIEEDEEDNEHADENVVAPENLAEITPRPSAAELLPTFSDPDLLSEEQINSIMASVQTPRNSQTIMLEEVEGLQAESTVDAPKPRTIEVAPAAEDTDEALADSEYSEAQLSDEARDEVPDDFGDVLEGLADMVEQPDDAPVRSRSSSMDMALRPRRRSSKQAREQRERRRRLINSYHEAQSGGAFELDVAGITVPTIRVRRGSRSPGPKKSSQEGLLPTHTEGNEPEIPSPPKTKLPAPPPPIRQGSQLQGTSPVQSASDSEPPPNALPPLPINSRDNEKSQLWTNSPPNGVKARALEGLMPTNVIGVMELDPLSNESEMSDDGASWC